MSFERCFRLADRLLLLDSDDQPLVARFDEIYPDCAAVNDGSAIRCVVRTHPALAFATLRMSAPFPGLASFASYVFPKRGITVEPENDEGWTFLMHDGLPFAASDGDGTLLMQTSPGWQSFAANMAVNLVLQAQSELFFFHAGTCEVGGKGVMITGEKAAGKTTTVLALGSRGHPVLGDEIAAIRRGSWEAVPFRRSLSIRDGIRPRSVDLALESMRPDREIYPDGEPRTRMPASVLFPAEARPVRLRAALFLRRFAAKPALEPVPRTPESLALLQPLGCTLWNRGASGHTMDLIRFFSEIRPYYLDPGSPEETAAAIETFLEAL